MKKIRVGSKRAISFSRLIFSSRTLVPVVAAGLILVSSSGCLSVQNQTTLDGGTAAPYVEAFIAYPGPQEKWAGPAAFVLHVVARESGMALVTVSSAFRNQTTEATSNTRAPSSEGGSSSGNSASGTSASGAPARGLTTDAARALLGHLAESVSGPLAPFQGCLSPVRVRLVREDGALVEKLGCRSDKGWARATSEIVSQFITAQVEGIVPAMPPTAPLVTPTADNKEVTEVVKASEQEVMRSGRAPASTQASLAASAEAAVRAAEAAAAQQPSDPEHTLPAPPHQHP